MGLGDIVRPEIGFRVPLTSEKDVVLQIENILRGARPQWRVFSNGCASKACATIENGLSWEGKAQIVTQILTWAARPRSQATSSTPYKSTQSPELLVCPA